MKATSNTAPSNAIDNSIPFELPNDPTLEAAVLGAILLEPQRLPDVRQILPTAEAFHDERNSALYGLLLRRDDAGEPNDLTSVLLPAKGEGISATYLAKLTTQIGSGAEVCRHALRLAELWGCRRYAMAAAELLSNANTGDLEKAEQYIIRKLDEITVETARLNTIRHIDDVGKGAKDVLEAKARTAASGQAAGVTTGIPTLDFVTGGWRAGQLVVLAGRPAMGKTAVALSFVRAAAEAGTPVCAFSLEMDNVSLFFRMLAGVSGVDSGNIRSGRLSSDDWMYIEQGSAELGKLPVYLSDKAGGSMASIRAQCRAMHRKGRCGMVVIDYLQLLGSDADRRNWNREREVADMSRAAKLLAQELDVPVLLLSQLSRKVEERVDKTPMLSDLRESGAIEQDADLVIFVHRPAYYGETTIDNDRFGIIPSEGVGILTIAKNREGSTCRVLVRHSEDLTRFEDYGAGR